jgi:hypothetical protein
MKRLAWFVMVAVVGLMLTGGSTGFGAPPKRAPAKHGGGKPAHSGAKHPSKLKPHPAHKGGAKSGNAKEKPGNPKKKENGKKSKEGAQEEHKDKLAESKPKKDSDDRREQNVTANKPTGASVSVGTPGAVGGGDAGAADAGVPSADGPNLPGRPQIFFSFNLSERDRYDAAARAAGVSRDEWIRSRLSAAISRELK